MTSEHSYEWIAERIDEMNEDSKPIPLINLPKSSCGALVYYTTTKENMKNVMRYGIKTDKVLSGYIKNDDIKIGNSIAIACVPQEKIYLHTTDRARFYNKDEPFAEWDARRMEWESMRVNNKIEDISTCLHKPIFLGHREDIVLKEKIPPENIIGCVDIVKTNNVLKYKINRNCRFKE